MKYHAYEMAHAMVHPMRLASQAVRLQLESPYLPFFHMPASRSFAAGLRVFERLSNRYGKPDWEIEETTTLDGQTIKITPTTVTYKPFCNLVHFARGKKGETDPNLPKLLIVAPMSGHYATLLRGTVQAMLPGHDVYITDWIDARDVPMFEGNFNLDDYIDYLMAFMRSLGPELNVMAVCQPAVPTLAATALLAQNDDPNQPVTLTLMGGPIDTRRNPTVVNKLAEEKPISWFESNVIAHVPFPNPGFGRPVYPGFMQLTGFMTMNLDRHQEAHWELFDNLVKGDEDSVEQHERFYDEYMAVMDLTAEFFLDTVRVAFQDHDLPDGRMTHRGQLVDCSAIRKTALITIEGENDDICGIGQTEAAQDLCCNVSDDERLHYVQPGVGHYGVFNGRRWRNHIQPRIADMICEVLEKRRQNVGRPANDDHANAEQAPATGVSPFAAE